jgi:hypothetical protein
MMIKILSLAIVIFLSMGIMESATAYVGPGAGLSLLGALWGLLLSVGAALAFVVLWPLRRLRKRFQAQCAGVEEQTNCAEQGSCRPGSGPRVDDGQRHAAN